MLSVRFGRKRANPFACIENGGQESAPMERVASLDEDGIPDLIRLSAVLEGTMWSIFIDLEMKSEEEKSWNYLSWWLWWLWVRSQQERSSQTREVSISERLFDEVDDQIELAAALNHISTRNLWHSETFCWILEMLTFVCSDSNEIHYSVELSESAIDCREFSKPSRILSWQISWSKEKFLWHIGQIWCSLRLRVNMV
jgi:hypothetical protein